jgi:hypothetical protein
MIIALDYDKTYTADPSLWDKFINDCKDKGHTVICITMRKPILAEEIDRTIFAVDRLYYTSRKAKMVYAKLNRIDVDIWIDDKPGWLFDDAPSAEG